MERMHSPDKAGTLGVVLDAATAYLKARGVAEARIAVEWLAARLLRCRRLDLRLRAEQPLAESQLEALRRGVRRVAKGEPVQYVVGRWEFRGHPLLVDRRALIPRPETEQLVQAVLDDRDLWSRPEPRVADVGTGSGCIAVSLARERPQGRYLATDVSAEALELAQANATLNGVAERIRFAQGDLADLIDPATLDAVVSNPPYIPSAAVERLAPTVRDFEPRVALDGGDDGLAVLRVVIEEASLALRSGGRLYLELGAENDQATAVSRALNELGFEQIVTRRDLSGAERFVCAVLAEGL